MISAGVLSAAFGPAAGSLLLRSVGDANAEMSPSACVLSLARDPTTHGACLPFYRTQDGALPGAGMLSFMGAPALVEFYVLRLRQHPHLLGLRGEVFVDAAGRLPVWEWSRALPGANNPGSIQACASWRGNWCWAYNRRSRYLGTLKAFDTIEAGIDAMGDLLLQRQYDAAADSHDLVTTLAMLIAMWQGGRSAPSATDLNRARALARIGV